MAWVPWWSVLGLMLALAVTRGEGEARSVRVPLLLLGGGLGLAVLLPGMHGAAGAAAFVGTFLRVMGSAALVSLAVMALEEGRMAWGMLGLGVLLLLGSVLPAQESPFSLALGLLAWVLTLLGAPGRENRPVLRLGNGGRALLGVTVAALVGAAWVGGLAVAVWPLQTPVQRPAGPAVPGQAQVQGARSPYPGEAQLPGVPPSVLPGPTARRWSAADLFPGADLPLLGGLLLVLALLFMVLRARTVGRRSEMRAWGWDLAALLGLLVTALLTLFFFAAAPPPPGGPSTGGLGVGAERLLGSGVLGAWSEAAASRLGAKVLWWLGLLAFVVLTLLAGAVVWLALNLEPRRAERAGNGEGAATSAPDPPEALHRVRLAYRTVLASLTAAGLGRGEAETPAEHAARAALELPVLARPLGTLVAAYAPVRYGGHVSDEEADAAEQAAQEVARLTAVTRRKREESETS